jgi:hypothetical protein
MPSPAIIAQDKLTTHEAKLFVAAYENRKVDRVVSENATDLFYTVYTLFVCQRARCIGRKPVK